MQEPRRSSNPYYPDTPLFLIFIPIISAFNYYLTYNNIRLNSFLLLTFTIDTVQGYFAWLAVRKTILFFDKKLPYRNGAPKRIIYQLIVTTLLGLLIISLLTELVSWIAKGQPAPIDFYLYDLFIISIWFFVINSIYIGLHYYYELQLLEDKRREENRIKQEGFPVKYGKKELWLRLDDLTGFCVEEDYAIAFSADGKKFYLDQSLDKVEQQLPTSFFFRLNRQVIVHRRLIAGFKRAEHGKLTVLLLPNDNFPAEVSVSRIKASAFRSWFHQK